MLRRSGALVMSPCQAPVHRWRHEAQSPRAFLGEGCSPGQNLGSPPSSDNTECAVPPVTGLHVPRLSGLRPFPHYCLAVELSSDQKGSPTESLPNIQDTFSTTWSTIQRIRILILTSENHLEKRLWLFISINWPYRYLG